MLINNFIKKFKIFFVNERKPGYDKIIYLLFWEKGPKLVKFWVKESKLVGIVLTTIGEGSFSIPKSITN